MRLVYLVKSKPNQSAVALADGDVSCTIAQFGESSQDLWLISYSTRKNSADEAKALSAIASGFDDLGIECLLLDDGASAYYERRLFEHIAGFERKLRAVLSMRVILLDGDLANKLVKDLEEIDFGELFERFFVDDAFVEGYRNIIKKGGPRYEKADLLAKIGALSEAVEWDRLFNHNEVPTVKEAHGFVREIRNDVMHAHRMSADRYREAKNVITACNAELDAMLEDLPDEGEQPGTFGEALANVLNKRPSESTWEDLAGATWEDWAKRACWADLANALGARDPGHR